jgi:hypothetical protein
MRARRALPSRYLVSGFAIAMAVAAALGSTVQAQAQVDPNLQTQSDIVSAPFSLRAPSAPQVAVSAPAPTSRSDARKVFKRAIERSKLQAKNVKTLTAKDSNDAAREANRCVETPSAMAACRDKLAAFISRSEEFVAFISPSPVIIANPTQKTTVKFTFPFNPTYETNVFKSDLNVHPDTSFGFGGGVQLTTAGARDYDIIAFSAGSASARYFAFPSQSLDVFTIQGAYQFFIGAYDGNGRQIDLKKPPSQNMITIDTIAVGVQNQTVFVPTYHIEKADFLTPQVTFARQNISLAGSGLDNQCFTAEDKTHESPGFCYFANLALTPGQTFSDVASLQNANLAASATLGKRFDDTNFVLALATTVTGKAFENVPGGRQDLLLQIGPTLAYSANKCFNASLAVTYNRNYSSLRTAVWNGFIVQPTLNVIFPVEPPPDKGQPRCG